MATRARNARVDLEVGRGKFDKGLRDARKGLRGFAADVRKTAAAGGKRIIGGVMGGLGLLGGLAGGLESVISDVVGFERAITRYSIATDQAPEATAAMRAEINKLSRDTGIAREEVLAGGAAYVALTGDAAGAASGMKDMTTVALATGASMEDLAAVAASMKNNLGIDPKDFKAGFAALHVQGKLGAIELRELATLLAGIAPSYAKFQGGSGAGGLAEMGAAVQIIRQGFGTSAEAATGLRALINEMGKGATKFGKIGVQVFQKDPKTGQTVMRNFRDIVNDTTQKLGGNQKKIAALFSSSEAARAFAELSKSADLYDELIQKSQDKAAIDRDAAKYQESDAAKIDRAMNALKLTVAEAFSPERLKAFASGLELVVEKLGKIIGYIESLTGGDDVIGSAEDAMGFSDQAVAAETIFRQNAGKGTPVRWEDARAAVDSVYDDLVNLRLSPSEQAVVARTRAAAGDDQDANAKAIAAVAQQRMIQSTVDGILARANEAAGKAGQILLTVKIGNETIAEHNAKSPTHRTRPGGR